jgi:predicted phosphodiesterase
MKERRKRSGIVAKRVAGLFDIHGNLPALDAVLEEVGRAGIDRIVIGGDVVPGPMPLDCLRRLLELDIPVDFIHGNCELAVLSQMRAFETGTMSYWGTTSGNPLPAADRENNLWTARQLHPEYEGILANWPRTTRLRVQGVGKTVFCHGTPRSETEIFLRTTAEERLIPVFEPQSADIAVCGHTHMQFDRMVGRTRVVNAGSVGMPFGGTGAFWLVLGPRVELRRTAYDVEDAATRIAATGYPGADTYVRLLRNPGDEADYLATFGKAELK